MSIKGVVQVGDRVGHPSWVNSPTPDYLVVRIYDNRFWLLMSGEEIGFPYYDEFFITEKGKREKVKSGFAKFIRSVEDRHAATELQIQRVEHG